MRNTLFENHGKTITEAHLKAYCKDLTGAEMAPCLLICNMIMPYVPAKSDWFSLPYQLPFVLMANELLRLTDYSKFTVSVSPLTNPGKLNCLSLDASMLFLLFCSPKIPRDVVRFDVFDFQGRRIVSKEDATSNKDAIFSSFFDIRQLQGTCNSYGLIFAQSLVMYPGVKTVAIRGFMQKHPVIASSDPSPKQAKPTPAKDKDTPLSRAVKEADKNFKALCQQRRDMLKEASLRAKKRAWSAANDNERPAIRVEIKQIQKARQRINISIAQAKQRLQGLRRQRYQERYPRVVQQAPAQKQSIEGPNQAVLVKAEEASCKEYNGLVVLKTDVLRVGPLVLLFAGP